MAEINLAETNYGLHIVRDFTIGNTRIKIADDCCRNTTPEEVQEILRRIAQRAQAAFAAAAYRDRE